MRRILFLGILSLTVLLAQTRTAPNTYGSATGFGSVLYPGVGHAPNVVNPGVRTGGPVLAAPPRPSHPSHGRRVIVPYPVYVGGYYGGFDSIAPQYQQPEPAQGYGPQQAPPPVVIINQAYRPETLAPVIRDYSDAMLPEAPPMRSYQAPSPPPMPDPKELAAARAESERPTIYLIAFKDKRIIPALAFWVEGDTLVYVNREETINRASLELIDKDFSKQLNRQQKLDFNVP